MPSRRLGRGGAPAGSAPEVSAETAAALAGLGVSRETLGRLAAYLDRLAAWNPTVNLVAAGTLADAWRRHVLDSAQLLRLLPPGGARRLADLGSGAGLPGLVLAICGAAPEVHLLEADRRKAAFLLDVAGRLSLPVTVHTRRIEAAPALGADLVTARALAPLPRLLELGSAGGVAAPGARWLLLEGRSADAGLLAADALWDTGRARVEPSLTSADGRVLILDGVTRRAGGGT